MLTEDDILKMGSFLEHQGMSDPEIDDWFEHAGVRGMKWGVRKPRKGTNVVTDAKIDINERRIYRTQHRQKGDAYRGSAAVGKVFLGAERQKRMQNTKMSKLKAQNKRLQRNKLTGMDKWGTYGSVTIKTLLLQGLWPGPLSPMRGPSAVGLLVSRKPKTDAERNKKK